tara:strand:+ start:1350 stop:1919 length:570 start_codon:yes stop_codon:yes gene_type:complete
MAYNIKDVFYLDISATVASGGASSQNGGSAQLDLSAYIDPIARSRQKGTGLAVYKTHFMILDDDKSNVVAPTEVGVMSYGLLAGAGLGDVSNDPGFNFSTDTITPANPLAITTGQYYSPASFPGSNGEMKDTVTPSKDVPYIIVRDNVCMVWSVKDSFTNSQLLTCRLEVAQISLDQATLNQLLRTQTV